MYRILNYLSIICFNMLVFFFVDISSQHIIFFSIACTLLFSSEFLAPTKFSFYISFSYLFLCLFYPLAFLFLPIASYSHAKNVGKFSDANILCPFIKYSSLFYLPVFIMLWTSQTKETTFLFFYILSLSALSFLLEYHSYSYEHLNQKYILSYDATREKNLHLKSENKALVAQQNYEISLAKMKERNRIARDIHDNVGHLLTRSILITGAIKTMNKDDSLNPNIESLDSSLNNAMSTIRASVHDLHSQLTNLQDAIRLIIGEFAFCKVAFDYRSTNEVPREIYFCFISIIKEALTNTTKHSNANKVSVQVFEHPGLYQLIFEDNGTTYKEKFIPGIGLENMAERVKQLHGNFNIRTENGFRIFITIPKKSVGDTNEDYYN